MKTKSKKRLCPPSQRPHRQAAQYHQAFEEDLLLIGKAEYQAANEILSEGRTPEKINELAANAQSWAMQCVITLAELEPQTPSCLTCQNDYCCHQPVQILAPEAVRLAQHLRATRTPEELDIVTERVRLATGRLGGRPLELTRTERHTCPLLEEGRCSVYMVRPTICRCYFSMDHSRCARMAADPSDQSYTVPTFGIQTASAVLGGLSAALRKHGIEHRGLLLAPALLHALSE